MNIVKKHGDTVHRCGRHFFIKVFDSFGISNYGSRRRELFDVYDCTLKHYANVDATNRCNTYFIWYKEKVLLPIWTELDLINK